MAERYWQLSMQDKRCLAAAKRCFIIAAENAMQIMQIFTDETNDTRLQMKGKIQQNLQLAEHIQQKIQADPSCDARAAFMAQFDAAE